MKHTLHSCNEDRCFVCEGGLALCTTCGGGEGDLPKECPGYRMSEEERELVMRGQRDFVDGKWRSK